MNTIDSTLSDRHRRIAERLGYYQDGALPSMWRHDEQPTRLCGWGLVLRDVQREIDRCDADGAIDDHVFPLDGQPYPGDRCCCESVNMADGAPPVRRWAR